MNCSDHLNLAMDDEEGATLRQLQDHLIMYRKAMGPQAGRKVLTVQTIPAWQEDDYGNVQLGRVGGFSLHAGVAVNTRERNRYRKSVTPLSACKEKPATADVEADGLEESNPRAGNRKGLCCTLKGIKAKRLKRVFNGAAFKPLRAGIEMNECSVCGGPIEVFFRVKFCSCLYLAC